MVDIPDGALAYRWAALADRFRLSPLEIAELTDWQIDHVLLHERDRDGALVPPPAPPKKPTKANRLATVAQLLALGVITPERAAELRAEVENGEG